MVIIEGKLSTREGGLEDKVQRCTCGAWTYMGIACNVCAILRGDGNELDRGSK